MPRSRRLLRGLAAGYLGLGVVFAAAGGDLCLGRRWVEVTLLELEHPALALQRVERVEVRPGAGGLPGLRLEVADGDGERFAFDLGAEPPLPGAGVTPWSGLYLHLGPTLFDLGESVHAVDASGRVDEEPMPLEAEARETALLLQLVQGGRGTWMASAAFPPQAGGAERRIHHGSFVRFPLPRVTTPAARLRSRRAAWILRPLAFAFDAVSWPVQGAVDLWLLATLDGLH